MQLAGRMAVSEAPEPSDVTWQNLYTTRKGIEKDHLLGRAFLNSIFAARHQDSSSHRGTFSFISDHQLGSPRDIVVIHLFQGLPQRLLPLGWRSL